MHEQVYTDHEEQHGSPEPGSSPQHDAPTVTQEAVWTTLGVVLGMFAFACVIALIAMTTQAHKANATQQHQQHDTARQGEKAHQPSKQEQQPSEWTQQQVNSTCHYVAYGSVDEPTWSALLAQGWSSGLPDTIENYQALLYSPSCWSSVTPLEESHTQDGM